METHSQAGQDIFVRAILGDGPAMGTFVDVGCCHPIELSNTYALEQLGWRGLLVDSDVVACDMCKKERKSPVLFGDAVKLNWRAQLQNHHFWPEVDYFSLDCDHASLEVLGAVLLSDVRFKVITMEHDAWRFGDELRVPMRALLSARGYMLVCGNVRNCDSPFEDWWVDLAKVDKTIVSKFMCENKAWNQILADAGY